MDRRAFIRAVATAAGTSATMGALSACGSSLTTPTAVVPSTAPLASTEIGKELRTVLDSHGITGATIREVIDSFDALPSERPLAITASVSPMLVSISDATSQFAVSLADQPFYLSLAPYRTYTHPCTDHSLGGCQGELPDTDLHVLIKSDSGDTLVDADATTYANGFAGFWVARDHKGTVTVTTEIERATAPFDSSTNGATCLTDLKLTVA